MPIMNGYEACKRIISFYGSLAYHNLYESQKPLIIAYSGFVDDMIRKNGKEAGFDEVIEAPLTQEKINGIVKKIKMRKPPDIS